MPKKTRIAAAIERAQKALTSQVFAAAMAEVPGRTPMGEVVAVLRKEGFAKHFETMTLSEFLAATGAGAGLAGPAPARRGRKAGASPVARSGARGKSFNTRTETGRNALDAAIAEFLGAAGSARAEAIRSSVGAAPAQIRQSMTRLMAAGNVTRKGQKRGTEYHWTGRSTGAAKAASPKMSAPKARKARKPRKATKARRASKAKARAAKG